MFVCGHVCRLASLPPHPHTLIRKTPSLKTFHVNHLITEMQFFSCNICWEKSWCNGASAPEVIELKVFVFIQHSLALFMECFQTTRSGWKHDGYINIQSACIWNTLESDVILVFPDRSKRFPGSPCETHCSVRLPGISGASEAEACWWKMETIHRKKWHEMNPIFALRGGRWWKSLRLHTIIECVKYLDKQRQRGHLKAFQTNWKRLCRHVSATELAFTRHGRHYTVICSLCIFARRHLPVTSLHNLALLWLLLKQGRKKKKGNWLSVAVHVSLTTAPGGLLSTMLVLPFSNY